MRRSLNINIKQLITEYVDGQSNKYLSKKYGIHRVTVQSILKRNNIELRKQTITSKKYGIDESYFETIDDQNKAYILGFLYADGNLYKNQIEISLIESDQHILNEISKKIYTSTVPLKWRGFRETKNRKSKPQCRLFITNKKIANDLRKCGLVENKSLKIRLPLINNNLYRHFIRGYFDGDGCLHISKNKGNNRVSIISNSKFLNDLKLKIETILEIQCHNKFKTKTVNSLNIYGNKQLKKFLDWIYYDADLKLKRKYIKYIDNF